MLSGVERASRSASARLMANACAGQLLFRPGSYRPPHRASMPTNRVDKMLIQQQSGHHRPATACSAGSGKGAFSPVVSEAVEGLNSSDPAAQVAGAHQLWRIAKSTTDYRKYEAELIPSGAGKALSDAVLSSNLAVRSHAVVALLALGVCNLAIASGIPAEKHVSIVVDLLRQCQTDTDEEWSRKVVTVDRKLVQTSAAGMLGLIATFHSTELIPVEAVPLIVNLLDEDSVDNAARISAPMLLMQLAAPKSLKLKESLPNVAPPEALFASDQWYKLGSPLSPQEQALQDAVFKSAAIDKIGSWLSSNQSHLVMVAAQFLGFIASSSKEARDLLEQKGIFDRLVKEFVESSDINEAAMQALSLWGRERLERELPKYMGFWAGEDRE